MNDVTGHPPTVECKQRNQWGHEAHISPIAPCGLHALEVTNINVVASNLLRTCFNPIRIGLSVNRQPEGEGGSEAQMPQSRLTSTD